MRASINQIRAILRHPSQDVRLFATRYFVDSLQHDPQAAEISWKALETFEPNDDGWLLWSAVNGLPQTPASLEYILDHGSRLASKWSKSAFERAPTYANTLSDVLAPFIEKLFGPLREEGDLRSAQQRVLALEWTREESLRNMNMIIADMEDENDIVYLRETAEALARYPDTSREFAMPILPRHLSAQEGEEDIDGGWRELAAISVAGYAGEKEAIPHLVEKLFDSGGEYVWEEAMIALTRIGGMEVIEAVTGAWLARPERACLTNFRSYATGALENVHAGQSLDPYRELFTTELDDSFRTDLAQAMLAQFDTDAFEPVDELVRRGDWDPMFDDPRVGLAAVRIALDIEPEESARLLAAVDTEYARRKRLNKHRSQ